ncbi:class F sortase [Streptomyces sp. NPDC058657]|uniref:class F sortase n=1 Tax=unclassified Streptomyces TaxID=2593676 RepID=UPI003656FBE7
MPRTSRRRPRPQRGPALRTAFACLGLTVAMSLSLSGCSTDAPPTAPTARPAATAETTASRAAEEAAPSRSGRPVQLSIPSIGVQSDIMRLGLNADGTVEVPPADKGMTTGWYTGGPAPGAPGPAVLIGHNETRNGRAVFHDLKKIVKGADITVRDERGTTVRFKVTGRETVKKNAFPTERVYGPTQSRALRLITCDGAFDAQGHPVDNLIVYAIKA